MAGAPHDKLRQANRKLRAQAKTLRGERQALLQKLEEAEQTLAAIRAGEVDSLVVEGPEGPRIFSLEAEVQYRVLIESMNEGAATVSEDGTILYCNACFARLLDLPLQRTMGSSIHDWIPERSRPAFRALLARAQATQVREEMALSGAGGEEIPAYLSASTMISEGRRVHCLVATDLREQKRSEALLIAEQRVRVQYEQAQQAIRVRDQLASMVSHDLRSPLAAVLAQVKLLSHQLDHNRLQETGLRAGLERIGRAGHKMDRLIDELLDIARLQAGEALELELRDTEVVGLVRRLVEDHQHATHQHRIRFHSTADEVFARWDTGRMERVINNLLSNAIKFSPEGGDIDVSLDRLTGDEVDQAILRVEDRGLGIPAGDLPSIFKWFARAGNVAGSIPGTGVGLAGARQIVEQHGGAIRVESRESQGSTFTLWIPLRPDLQRPEERAGSADGRDRPL